MWAGVYPHDHIDMLNIVLDIADGYGMKELFDRIQQNGASGYNSQPMNLVVADNGGDIGYMMLLGYPNRKDQTPYIGNRVLDGTTTAYDWNGLLAIKELPFSINPEKGYFVTANNRQMPDHSTNDVAATSFSTPRAERIDEMISYWISNNHKITV